MNLNFDMLASPNFITGMCVPVLHGSPRGGLFLMSEVPLYPVSM